MGILKTRSLFILIILSTIQKIIPLVILSNISIRFDLIYIIIFINTIFLLIILSRIINLNKFLQINRINYFDKLIITIIFISLGGIPPLLGFLIKYVILKFIIIYEKIFFINNYFLIIISFIYIF